MKLKPVLETKGEELKVGWIIKYDNDIYKVMMVNFTRAYCVKLGIIAKKEFSSKAEELSYAQRMADQSTTSISARSQVSVYGVHRSNVDKEIIKRRNNASK